MSLGDLADLISAALSAESVVVNIYQVVKVAMAVIETAVHLASSSYTGAQKLQMAKDLIPQVLSIAVSAGKLTQAQADTLSAELSAGADVIDNVVEFIIALTNNPNLIQFGKWVKNECATGCAPTPSTSKASSITSVSEKLKLKKAAKARAKAKAHLSGK